MVRYATHDGYDVGSNPAGYKKKYTFYDFTKYKTYTSF